MLSSRSVEQILIVLAKVRQCRGDGVIRAYQRAVTDVAKDYDVTYQTIGDLCRRRLGLENINQFYGLLEEWLNGDIKRLRSVLIKSTTSAYHYKIENYFKQRNGALPMEDVPSLEVREESFSFRLHLDIARKLKVLSLMDGDSLPEWLSKVVSEVVEQRYKDWLTTQV